MKVKRTQCRKCRWHGQNAHGYEITCDWALYHAPKTCLQKGPGRTTHDIRGEDPEHCALFETGRPNSRMKKKYKPREKRRTEGEA